MVLIGLTPDSVRGDHSWKESGDHMWCYVLNSGWSLLNGRLCIQQSP